MPGNRIRSFMPVIIVFILFNAFFITARDMLNNWGVDRNVVLVGNLILFLITAVSFYMGIRGLNNPNPHAFVRAVYSSIILKLFLCIIAAFIYISIYKKDLNKPALFICMGLYLLYTFIEVNVLTKMLRRTEK